MKLDRKMLEGVTQVYSHAYAGAACPDGTAAAILLNDVLEGVPIAFLVHGSPEMENLVASPGQLFVDITPPRERVQQFVDAGAIVLDHHDKQRDLVECFGERGVYADANAEPGVSGAVLAFREVWSFCTTVGSDSYQRAQTFAKLAGVRDTWQTKHEDWIAACAQAEALRFYPWRYLARVESPFGYNGNRDLNRLMEIGTILIERRSVEVKRRVAEAYGGTTSQGSRVMIVATIETSDIAEAVGDEADLVIGFEYRKAIGADGILLVLSLRSHTNHDVGAFCLSLGGGGHRAAAGVTMPVISATDPYTMILRMLDEYEREHIWRAP